MVRYGIVRDGWLVRHEKEHPGKVSVEQPIGGCALVSFDSFLIPPFGFKHLVVLFGVGDQLLIADVLAIKVVQIFLMIFLRFIRLSQVVGNAAQVTIQNESSRTKIQVAVPLGFVF